MFSKVKSFSLLGLEGLLIDVEVDLKYRSIDGSLKVLSTRKTSIVDVLIE